MMMMFDGGGRGCGCGDNGNFGECVEGWIVRNCHSNCRDNVTVYVCICMCGVYMYVRMCVYTCISVCAQVINFFTICFIRNPATKLAQMKFCRLQTNVFFTVRHARMVTQYAGKMYLNQS